MKTYHHLLIYAFLIVVIFLVRECSPQPEPCPEPQKPDTVITVKEVPVDTIIYRPKIIRERDSFPFDRWHKDTSLVPVARDYFKVKDMIVPLKDDSIAKLDLKATVYMNELYSAELTGKFFTREKDIIHEVPVPEPKRNKIYLGMQMTGGMDHFGAGPALMYQSKQDHAYSVSYDPINRIGGVTVWFKIRLKK